MQKKLMTLFSKKGFSNEDRHEFIYNWTDGRTESTKDLTHKEKIAICNFLIGKQPTVITPELELQLRDKRSTVLALAQKVGIHDPNDWSKFNRFMSFRSIKKKQLNKYSLDELDQLIRQFRSIKSKQ